MRFSFLFLRYVCCIFCIIAVVSSAIAQINSKGRWTEQAAWQWEKKVGVIKGFNAPVEAYPGMGQEEIFRKAQSLGYNSVRIWMPADPSKCVEVLRGLVNLGSKYNLTISPVLELYDIF